jgi:glutaredoxin-related protein
MPDKISLAICHTYSVRVSAQVDFVMVSLTAAKHNAKKLFRIENKRQAFDEIGGKNGSPGSDL